jgi:hypothetical protein
MQHLGEGLFQMTGVDDVTTSFLDEVFHPANSTRRRTAQ